MLRIQKLTPPVIYEPCDFIADGMLVEMNSIIIEKFDVARILYKELYGKIISSRYFHSQITNHMLKLCINKLPIDTCYIDIKKENNKTLSFKELPYRGNLKICYASTSDNKQKYVREMMLYALHKIESMEGLASKGLEII